MCSEDSAHSGWSTGEVDPASPEAEAPAPDQNHSYHPSVGNGRRCCQTSEHRGIEGIYFLRWVVGDEK